jgi:CDP-glucose 4,6-dehydratase
MGGGDWSENRLIPDAIKAWRSNQVLTIRKPKAVRPWQHVLEPLSGYLSLAEKIFKSPDLAGAYNFGPPSHEAADVQTVIEYALKSYGTGEVQFENEPNFHHESGLLMLDISKAQNILNFQSNWSLSDSVQLTISWYKQQQQGFLARELCEIDIQKYLHTND